MSDPETIQWTLARNFAFANGPDVDRTVWQSPQWHEDYNPSFLGQTAIRNIPDYGPALGSVPVVNNAARLRLSTFNPKDPTYSSFLGAQIGTIQRWGIREHRGVAFEASVLCPIDTPHGAVAAFFAYHLLSVTPFTHDEIDFEFASRHWREPGEAINTNVYIADNDGTKLDQVKSTAVDFSKPITFRIEWLRSAGIRWFINRQLIRSETKKVPQSDMSLVLNFWVPDTTWPWAYSPAIQPTGSGGIQEWTYQVTGARVFTT